MLVIEIIICFPFFRNYCLFWTPIPIEDRLLSNLNINEYHLTAESYTYFMIYLLYKYVFSNNILHKTVKY